MGSGGPRGLQILQSGANSVRGGFDSHAFPPLAHAGLVALLATALTAGAVQAAVAEPAPANPASTTRDTTKAAPPRPVATSQAAATAADTTKATKPAAPSPAKFRVTAVDTTRRQPPTEPKGFERPSWVMMRSLAFPAWGQMHNHAWLKAGAIGATEGYLIARLVDDKLELNRLNRDIDRAANDRDKQQALVETYNARSNKFAGRQWWLGALLAYSMLDAYIDAHFRNFSIDLEDDPALPPEERHAAGLKLSWQEHF